MARNDPLENFRFRLEIDGIQQAGFSEVTGFDVSVDPIGYREGNEPGHVRKLPGLTRYGNLTLKWGVADSTKLFDWHRQIVDGDIVRKNLTIVMVDEAGRDVARFDVVEAWPCKCEPVDLNARGNPVSVETLELRNQGVKRVW